MTDQDKSNQDKLQEQLGAARSAMEEKPLTKADQQALSADLEQLERQLQQGEPVSPAPFLELLQDWEARLEAEHPVLAGVLSNVVRHLESSGI